MEEEKTLTKKFSPDFQHDIADLLDICQDNGTDSITIDMKYGEYTLSVEMTFSVYPTEKKAAEKG